MTWTMIRLELARVPGFPNGSAARSFVLRLPLDAEGRIDEAEYRHRPELATARRFWPSEADRHGRLHCTADGWTIACGMGEGYRMAAQAIREGGQVVLTDQAGAPMPFVVRGLAPA